MLTNKKYIRSKPLLVAVSLMAVMLAFLLAGCQTESEPEPQKQEQPGNAGGSGTSGSTNNDSTGGENTGNTGNEGSTGSSSDTKPENCTHDPSQGGTQTCKGYQCTVCGTWYGDKNPENHAISQPAYTDNGDGATHGRKHQCCGAESQAEPHEIATASQPTYRWSADYSACTAAASCTLCTGKLTETAPAQKGDAKVTATFKTAEFAAQTIAKVTFTETDSSYLAQDYVLAYGWDHEENLSSSGSGSAVGTPDNGKTAWVEGDQLLVSLESKVYGRQAATLTFTNGKWNPSLSTPLHCLQSESPAVTVLYAPGYEIGDGGNIAPKDGSPPGTSEYITFYGEIQNEQLSIDEIQNGQLSIVTKDATINYSRLRIAATSGHQLSVTVTDFIPAGTWEAGEHTYTLTADGKGNAYLYGILSGKSIVTVDSHRIDLSTFLSNGSEHSKSYALSASATK